MSRCGGARCGCPLALAAAASAAASLRPKASGAGHSAASGPRLGGAATSASGGGGSGSSSSSGGGFVLARKPELRRESGEAAGRLRPSAWLHEPLASSTRALGKRAHLAGAVINPTRVGWRAQR